MHSIAIVGSPVGCRGINYACVQVFSTNKLIRAAPWKQCFATAKGSTIFCIVWYILLYLDRLLVVLIEEELLSKDSGIMVAGFDVIPLQALQILSTPCCSHIGYVLRRYIGRYVSTWRPLMASINDVNSWRPLVDAINGGH